MNFEVHKVTYVYAFLGGITVHEVHCFICELSTYKKNLMHQQFIVCR